MEVRLPGTATALSVPGPLLGPQQGNGRSCLIQYQNWILFGFKHAMPKAINWSKLYEVRQGPLETLGEFAECLRVAARRYTNINPEKPEEAVQLDSIFIVNSAPDIRKKLQKLEGDDLRDLRKLQSSLDNF